MTRLALSRSLILPAALAAACVWTVPALAQEAAGRLPDSFATPSAAAPRPAVAPPAVAQTTASPEAVAADEAMLRKSIAAMQAGQPNYGDMTDDLAAQMRERAARMGPLVQSFGALKSVAHVGQENGAELFAVAFERQATQWIIARNDDDRIVVLLFRPAPPG